MTKPLYYPWLVSSCSKAHFVWASAFLFALVLRRAPGTSLVVSAFPFPTDALFRADNALSCRQALDRPFIMGVCDCGVVTRSPISPPGDRGGSAKTVVPRIGVSYPPIHGPACAFGEGVPWRMFRRFVLLWDMLPHHLIRLSRILVGRTGVGDSMHWIRACQP